MNNYEEALNKAIDFMYDNLPCEKCPIGKFTDCNIHIEELPDGCKNKLRKYFLNKGGKNV